MIQIENVGKAFENRIRARQYIFQGLNLEIQSNEFIAIIGPSGCGKSTLIKMIGGLEPFQAGSITIENKSVLEAQKEGSFSFVFQTPVLLPWKTVKENVMLPSKVLQHFEHTDSEQLLKMVGLDKSANYYPYELSGGMKQRVAIARAFSFNPKILFMDEPFSALDEFTRDKLNLELLEIWKTYGSTVLFVTHNIREALFLADRILVLSGKPARIVEDYKVPFSRPRNIELLYSKELWIESIRLKEKL